MLESPSEIMEVYLSEYSSTDRFSSRGGGGGGGGVRVSRSMGGIFPHNFFTNTVLGTCSYE